MPILVETHVNNWQPQLELWQKLNEPEEKSLNVIQTSL